MNKELNYLVEFLAKSDDKDATLYKQLLDFLDENLVYTSSSYDAKKLILLAKKDNINLSLNFEENLRHLDKILEMRINPEIKGAKVQLLSTLLATNFKKKKEDFDKVETSIYKCLSAYIYGLTRGLEIFYAYTLDDVKKPELFISYASFLHEQLFYTIFNKEEQKLLEEKLKEVMSIYLSLYARYLYI
ncbi:MAG TPA: hypothetical protein CFH82_09335 [Sulfurospirillum sp. UBA12182]|nr:MAG TPA: hypothetical protein CFH82_09335 [Sulfurospirillum sp. UBA12182]